MTTLICHEAMFGTAFAVAAILKLFQNVPHAFWNILGMYFGEESWASCWRSASYDWTMGKAKKTPVEYQCAKSKAGAKSGIGRPI